MICVITRKQLKILILDPCTSFLKKTLSFVEKVQSDCFFAPTKVNNTDVVIRKRAINICDDFGLRHLFVLILNICEMK